MSISPQSIQLLLRYFGLDQSGGRSDRVLEPCRKKMYYLIHHLDLGLLSVLQASHETIPKFYIVEENQIPTKRNIIIMNEKHYIHHAV